MKRISEKLFKKCYGSIDSDKVLSQLDNLEDCHCEEDKKKLEQTFIWLVNYADWATKKAPIDLAKKAMKHYEALKESE